MVSARRNAEIRWGLGLVAFLLTIVSLALFVDFPGTAIGSDAAWGLFVGILAVVLFFYLLLPSRQTGLRGPAPPGHRRRRR